MLITRNMRLHRAAWAAELRPWLPWLPWALAALLAVGGVAFSIERLAERHLAADAERAALSWARHVGTTVPDIDLVFLGDPPSPQAQERLTGLRGTTGVFRFKLFDNDGTLLLVSDSVATPPRPEDVKAADQVRARQSAREGRPVVSHKRGNGQARPAIYSEAYVPVRHGERTIGVIELYLDQTELAATTTASFRQAALLASAALALCFGFGAVLLQRHTERGRRAEERASFLAHHDALTGALNHTRFYDGLERACQLQRTGGIGLAVLCVDLDRFGEINDLHGHGVGDELLRRVAERLHGVLRGADLLARLAGDRFAVLQREASDSQAVKSLAQRIVDSLAQPHALPGLNGRTGDECTITVTASVGAAIHGVDGTDATALLHNAELALLRVKAAGRAGWGFYDATLDRALQERRTLAQDLREALAHGSLRLHYQPLYAADGGALTGYEALARWPHPTRGFVPPSDFIPVAEDSGQIEALGRWVLASACAEAASWPQPLSIAVNLSAAQFRRGDTIVDEVRAVLAASGLAPQRLELEITESLLITDTEQVLATLAALHTLGVRIAMDDFGTGYSSLAYLWRFPFDKLKIDRAFTQGLGSDGKVDVIVRSIITLAHSLAIRVNAEGVETDAQRDALRRHGCDELQGYLLGRPQPRERLAHLEHAPAVVAPGALLPAIAMAG